MGTLHRAFDTLAGREVAYKRLRIDREQNRPRMTGLFRSEYDTSCALSHPNTVEAYDYGFDDHGPYYTMELLSGEDLSKLAPLPWQAACRAMRDVASALALLHARRLLHRDLSPSNVRLTLEGKTKLLDYGAVSPFGDSKELVGTLPFVAPECLRGAALDQRSDLFSLGALLYWTLTQRLCFRAQEIEDLWAAYRKPIVPPSRFVPDIPRELDELVLSLLQVEVHARPSSAAYVIERLTAIAQLPCERDEQELALGYLSRPALIERETVLGPLRAALGKAVAGTGSVALIEASAGMGRSALLDRVAFDAQLAGAIVLRAEGTGDATSFELGRRLVKVGLSTFADPQLGKELTGRYAASEATGVRARSAVEAVERHGRIASLLRQRLLEFSRRNPLVLLVDDAQRADADSLSVLAAMIDELHEHPILIVLSVRSDDRPLPHAVQHKLARSAAISPLAPLSEQGIVELVASAFGDVPYSRSLALFVHRESGGVPGAAMDLLRLLIQRGDIVYKQGTFALPQSATLRGEERSGEALLARTRGLSACALDLLHILSVHRGSLSLRELSIASGHGEREAMLALTSAMHRGLLLETNGAYFVASQLLRAELLRQTDSAAIRAYHAAVARSILLTAGEELEPRLLAGYHQLRSGPQHEHAGAQLIAETARALRYDAPALGGSADLFAEALAVYRRHGESEDECLDLLVPLTYAGYYGELEAHRNHVVPTLDALTRRCGAGLSRALGPWLGTKRALALGMLWATLRAYLFRTRSPRTLRYDIEALFSCVSCAVAAAASAFDARQAARMVGYLDVFAPLPKESPGALSREFCLATSELCNNRIGSARARYERVLALLKQRLPMEPRLQDNLRQGCLHGLAQCAVENDDPLALELSDQLEQEGLSFSTHCETVRVGYYAARGDSDDVERHRARAETAALLGGVSWAATAILTVRCVYASALTGDAFGLARALVDLERVRFVSEPLGLHHQLAQAHLEVLRGQHEPAIATYERILDAPTGVELITFRLDCAMYAAALCHRGDPAGARAVCLRALASAEPGLPLSHRAVRPLQQALAQAEAQLGLHREAAQRLEACLAALRDDNPYALGVVHRDRAYVALHERDQLAFAQHAALAETYLRKIHNPTLIAQLETLFTEAARAGFLVRMTTDDPDLTDDLEDLGTTIVEGTPLKQSLPKRLS